MKKKITFIVFLVFTIALSAVVVYLFSENSNVKAEAEKSDKLLKELQREQALVQQERQVLEQKERSLKAFQDELDKQHNQYLINKKKLEDLEKVFNEKVEAKMVDRQTIETYENIDAEQAAVLIKNLYLKDSSLATLIMRKIAGKKAGKILENMIPIDKAVATSIAEDTLTFYRPEDPAPPGGN